MSTVNKEQTESKLVTEGLNYLLKKGIFCWRQNNLAVFDKKLNAYRAHTGLNGIPDIIAITPPTKKQCGGIFVGLEAKTSKGKLSVHQVSFRDRCFRHNCEYHVFRSLDELKKLDYLWE